MERREQNQQKKTENISFLSLEERRRGRPMKYDRKTDPPIQEQYFKNNSAALVSANLHYTGNVLRVLKKPINNRGFLIYHFNDERDLYTDINQIKKVPEKLTKLLSNVIQCGPRCVIDELVELFRWIEATEGKPAQVAKQLLKTNYDGKIPRAIEFTDRKLLEGIMPSFSVAEKQKDLIRTKFEDYLQIVVDIIKCELNEGADSKYCQIIPDLIRDKESITMASRAKALRELTQMPPEPPTRKMRKSD